MKWSFDNTTPVYRHGEPYKFNTSMSAYMLSELFEKGTIIYKGEIQRGIKITKKGKEKPVFSPKHVNEILKAIIEDKIHGGTITLNYSKDNENEIEFDEDNRMVSGNGELIIVDGQHRIYASNKLTKMYDKDSDSVPDPKSFEFPVIIENLTEEEAKTLFSEYANTPMKISKTRSEFLNVDDTANKIVRQIMKESDLKNKVETIKTTVNKQSTNVVTFGVLSTSVRKYFSPSTKKETERTAKYLVSFFDELIDLFSEIFNSEVHIKNEYRKNTFILDTLFFQSYIALAKELENDDNWDNKLIKLKNEIKVDNWKGGFLSKENPIFSTIMREGNKIINNTATQKYVTETLIDYIVNDKLPEIKQAS